MKQRVVVRGIIKKDERTLFVRRTDGSQYSAGRYETPGGRIEAGEQPDEALRRLIREQTSLEPQTIQLYGTKSYSDFKDPDAQIIALLYLVSSEGSNGGKVRLNARYDHYEWKKLSEIPHEQLTEATKVLLLDDAVPTPQPVEPLSGQLVAPTGPVDLTHVIIHTDGGSRGNPGPSASAVVVLDDNQSLVYQGGSYLGITTNNQAEYHGVRLGLEKAIELGAKRVDFKIDSLLVVNQMNGIYKIKNRDLWPINERIRALAKKCEKVTFTHVRREFNQLADGMVNKILDEAANDDGAGIDKS